MSRPLTFGRENGYAMRMTCRGKKTFVRLPTGWLCLLAVLLWAIVPQGAMPTRNGDGGLTFALCTTEGPVLMDIGPDGALRPASPDRHQDGKHPCPFAAGPFAAAAPGTVLPHPALLLEVEAVALPRALPGRSAPSHLRPESRGPPAIA
jgi:hypothetical protein